jgi:DNA-binding GntR family transcriptional regulator
VGRPIEHTDGGGDTDGGLWRPAPRDRLSEEVANRLRAAILSGELGPGSRIVEATIAKRLDVSKSPVREAIRMLAGEGIIVATRRRGAFVRGMTEKDAREIRVLRITLESLAVELAMDDVDPGWLARLQQIVSDMRSAQDRPQLLQLHAEFHEALTSRSRNERLGAILANLRVQTRAVLPFIDLLSGGREIEADEHDAIVAAVQSGDVDATNALIKEHIGTTATQLEALWRSTDQTRNSNPEPNHESGDWLGPPEPSPAS